MSPALGRGLWAASHKRNRRLEEPWTMEAGSRPGGPSAECGRGEETGQPEGGPNITSCQTGSKDGPAQRAGWWLCRMGAGLCGGRWDASQGHGRLLMESTMEVLRRPGLRGECQGKWPRLDPWRPQHSKAGGGVEGGGTVRSKTGLGRKTSASGEDYFKSQVNVAQCPGEVKHRTGCGVRRPLGEVALAVGRVTG